MEQMKVCRKCGTEKLFSEFHKDNSKKYGVASNCKSCKIKTSHAYYVKHAEKINAKVNVYRKSYVPKFNRQIDSKLKNLCTSAKNRNKFFNLQFTDLLNLYEKQGGLCAYTKLPLVATANQFNTVSLDRINSSVGYTVGNIQLVCTAINKMKQEYSEDLFVFLCHLVAQNNSLTDLPDSILAQLKTDTQLNSASVGNV